MTCNDNVFIEYSNYDVNSINVFLITPTNGHLYHIIVCLSALLDGVIRTLSDGLITTCNMWWTRHQSHDRIWKITQINFLWPHNSYMLWTVDRKCILNEINSLIWRMCHFVMLIMKELFRVVQIFYLFVIFQSTYGGRTKMDYEALNNEWMVWWNVVNVSC